MSLKEDIKALPVNESLVVFYKGPEDEIDYDREERIEKIKNRVRVTAWRVRRQANMAVQTKEHANGIEIIKLSNDRLCRRFLRK